MIIQTHDEENIGYQADERPDDDKQELNFDY